VDYDVIVIGAGHNGLVAAAYLAQAGCRVGVFERRDQVGGAVSTKEIIPGYQFDLGGSAHILIRLTPIVEELGLERFGLDYIDLDPIFSVPLPGLPEDGALRFWRDPGRTAEEIDQHFPGDGANYRRFLSDWRGFAETMREMFLTRPGPLQLGKTLALGKSTPLPWQDELRRIVRPYGHVVREYFDAPVLQAALMWMAAQSGPPPTEPLSGPFVLWHPLYHEGGVARPRGGSGELTQALRRHVEAHGGDVFTGAPVEEILVERSRACAIKLQGPLDGTRHPLYSARSVLSATHALETFGALLPEAHRPSGYDRMRVGNGFGAMLRLALDAPVEYAATRSPAENRQARTGLQLLCRDPAQLHSAYGDYLAGRPAADPPLVAMTFSAADDTLAPEGHEVLWLWGQYFPYELADGKAWSDVGPEVADRLIDTFEQYAPDTREKIVGQLFQHPEWLERRLGLYRGNVMHLEMSLDQMFALRPVAGQADYRTSLKGLYLAGASTHPGGGIMGASGRNAARELLKDLRQHRV
jgi:phytoene dehydrogenase-like protein